ncbi:hypothetical protein [Bacteroides faecalis]|uniref:Uncharacterized protein n=1 Tax=Bacteroides faecalis TaxID=2447885 RepID=A0A401LY46_9BACE|nr:hypothetical protein [Bacteroides faecalis]GCB36468.1 hypothetical protein KGMB02408_34130 [Bacteroides faecalis]
MRLNERKKLILSLYGGDKSLTSDKLEKLIDEHLHPEKYDVADQKESLCEMFQRYVNGWLDTGVIGLGRKKHYDVVIRELNRFLIINGIDGEPVEVFNKDMILKFREFLRIEHTLLINIPVCMLI